jgi:UDP-glucuronate 4-epimerase
VVGDPEVKILVTGAAGFIGMHVAQLLLARGDAVVGVDNLNGYYDPQLKRDRLARLAPHPGFRFVKKDISDRREMEKLFSSENFEAVVHLAAQPGVRYSLQNPHAYIEANIAGFMNVLEGCRHAGAAHLVYASSSSVYGGNKQLPYRESDSVDHPVSLYAATKKANELMAHTYSHLFGLPSTGLRFFTVYGPWVRPDMALYRFTRAIVEGRPIDVYNHGRMTRDFTYIDDIAEGVVRTLDAPVQAKNKVPYQIFNIGNHEPVQLLRYIEAIEKALGVTAEKNFLPLQNGDVLDTFADVSALEAWTGFRPRTSVEQGVKRFVAWYRDYYRIPAEELQ